MSSFLEIKNMCKFTDKFQVNTDRQTADLANSGCSEILPWITKLYCKNYKSNKVALVKPFITQEQLNPFSW